MIIDQRRTVISMLLDGATVTRSHRPVILVRHAGDESLKVLRKPVWLLPVQGVSCTPVDEQPRAWDAAVETALLASGEAGVPVAPDQERRRRDPVQFSLEIGHQHSFPGRLPDARRHFVLSRTTMSRNGCGRS